MIGNLGKNRVNDSDEYEFQDDTSAVMAILAQASTSTTSNDLITESQKHETTEGLVDWDSITFAEFPHKLSTLTLSEDIELANEALLERLTSLHASLELASIENDVESYEFTLEMYETFNSALIETELNVSDDIQGQLNKINNIITQPIIIDAEVEVTEVEVEEIVLDKSDTNDNEQIFTEADNEFEDTTEISITTVTDSLNTDDIVLLDLTLQMALVEEFKKTDFVDVNRDVYEKLRSQFEDVFESDLVVPSQQSDEFNALKEQAKKTLKNFYLASAANQLKMYARSLEPQLKAEQQEDEIEQVRDTIKKLERVNNHPYIKMAIEYAEHALAEIKPVSNQKTPDVLNESEVHGVDNASDNTLSHSIHAMPNSDLTNTAIDINNFDQIDKELNGIAKDMDSIPLYRGRSSLISKTGSAIESFNSTLRGKASLLPFVITSVTKSRFIDLTSKAEKQCYEVNVLGGGQIIEHSNAFEFTSSNHKKAAKLAIKAAKIKGWHQLTAWGSDEYLAQLKRIGLKHNIEIIPINTDLLTRMATYANTPVSPNLVTKTSAQAEQSNSEKLKSLTNSTIKDNAAIIDSNTAPQKNSLSKTIERDLAKSRLQDKTNNLDTEEDNQVPTITLVG
jgi:hypothetical protein